MFSLQYNTHFLLQCGGPRSMQMCQCTAVVTFLGEELNTVMRSCYLFSCLAAFDLTSIMSELRSVTTA